jgi:energy-coupling factor transporter ATP-binding protein EcfA2
VAAFGLTDVRVRGFRTLRDARFRPGAIAAIVGEPSTGKSNLLNAIWALLDPEGAPLTADDVCRDGSASIQVEATLGDGSRIAVEGPSGDGTISAEDRPPGLFFPSDLRAGSLVAPPGRAPASHPVATIVRDVAGRIEGVGDGAWPTEPPARELVVALETWAASRATGLIVLIEEPELFLPPQVQRYLYRLLRQVADAGNQVLYSTHSPALLNVVRLDELVFTERRPSVGTTLLQPEPLPADEEFRAYSEFDSSRSELFLARAAVLVEGLTEKLTLPFAFEALGHDPDRERISIVECGGKGNIPLFAGVCRAVGLPFVAVHDRDAPPGEQPSDAERELNALIADVAGDDRVELAPDFEGVARIHGDRRKPARAWRRFAGVGADAVPEPLVRVVERAVALAGR